MYIQTMENMSWFGSQHYAEYLESYAKGDMSFMRLVDALNCCFNDRV